MKNVEKMNMNFEIKNGMVDMKILVDNLELNDERLSDNLENIQDAMLRVRNYIENFKIKRSNKIIGYVDCEKSRGQFWFFSHYPYNPHFKKEKDVKKVEIEFPSTVTIYEDMFGVFWIEVPNQSEYYSLDHWVWDKDMTPYFRWIETDEELEECINDHKKSTRMMEHIVECSGWKVIESFKEEENIFNMD